MCSKFILQTDVDLVNSLNILPIGASVVEVGDATGEELEGVIMKADVVFICEIFLASNCQSSNSQDLLGSSSEMAFLRVAGLRKVA